MMNTSKKVYVVTNGSYSEYAIEGIFSTRELAEAYVQKAKRGTIEEWVVDEQQDVIQRPYWQVNVALPSGEISALNFREQPTAIVRPHQRADVYGERSLNRIKVLSYVSLEHARKVAVEKYQEYLRTKPLRDYSETLYDNP